MPFDFPTSPAVDQIANGYRWNGYAWVAGVAPEIVREQFFDLNGLSQKDVAVPSWAKGCVILMSSNTTAGVSLQLSMDGTTFLAGASDYAAVGATHYSGSQGYATNAQVALAYLLMDAGGDASSVPHNIRAEMNLVRTATTVFHMKSYVKSLMVGATALARTWWGQGWLTTAAAGANLQVKAMRFAVGAAWGPTSWLSIRWLGEAASAPVIGDPQYFYPGASSPGGTATQNNDPLTVGMRFTPLVAGKITGVRWYNGAVESGTSGKVAVWTDAGVLVASQTFSGLSTAIGWRLVALDYTIVANQTYRVGVWHTLGSDSHAWYMAQANKFASAGITVSGVMTMPVGPNQNMFTEPTISDIAFPNTAFNASGYAVDVEFRAIT